MERRTLASLLGEVEVAELRGDPQVALCGVTQDSRRVEAGSLFVALRGGRRDGMVFAAEALQRGAAAVVSEQAPPEGLEPATWVIVPDCRAALPRLARAFHGAPDRDLVLVGITGTNGKTTTSSLLREMLTAAGRRCGLIGGVEVLLGEERLRPLLTTPEADEFYELLARMRRGGCTHCVMEVSSHALELGRVEGARFAAAAFTNLSRDHLDFHGTMERYFQAKRSLFLRLLDGEGVAVLNTDDPHGAELARSLPGKVVTCGRSAGATVREEETAVGWEGISLTLAGGALDRPLQLHSPLLGRTNTRNLLLAAALALELGADGAAVARGAASFRGVIGRFQPFVSAGGFRVIVDYAHTEDALRNLLDSLREMTRGRLITVFGCGGDRDPGKRPAMGRAAAQLSDLVIITSDNPRTEDPLAIIAAVEHGARAAGPGAAEPVVVPDRRQAIARAIAEARPGDTVAVAGKGHEDYQILGRETVPFDDREVVRGLLAEERNGGPRAAATGGGA